MATFCAIASGTRWACRWALVAALCMIVRCDSAAGFGVASSKPLLEVVGESTTVVCAEVVAYSPDPAAKLPSGTRLAGGGVAYLGADAFVVLNTLKWRGRYTFRVTQLIKGKADNEFSLLLPDLMACYFGGARPQVAPGGRVLLFLARRSDGTMAATDPTLPLIPLAGVAGIPDELARTNESVDSRVVKYLVMSLTDPKVRMADAYLLRSVVLPQVVEGLRPYENDPDLHFRDNVLFALANNQQTEVIGRIINLEHQLNPDDSEGPETNHANALAALETYDGVGAVAALNKLLFDRSWAVRLVAVMGLKRVANATSVPYLWLALRDPEPKHFIGPTADTLLRRLVSLPGQSPALPPGVAVPLQEVNLVADWWRDELSGRHQVQGELDGSEGAATPTAQQFSSGIPDSGDLFNRVTSVRREALQKLEQHPDPANLPYLLVALQDPDPQLAWRAYRLLCDATGLKATAVSAEELQQNRAKETAQLYGWWEDQLAQLAGRMPPVPHPGRAGLANSSGAG